MRSLECKTRPPASMVLDVGPVNFWRKFATTAQRRSALSGSQPQRAMGKDRQFASAKNLQGTSDSWPSSVNLPMPCSLSPSAAP
ncbi:hypothetical protein [Glutamicibacter sp. TV12E]|uniref:hypothetical protein n=1 Tax=Glutamicibacter sp. TV12E TaxID=3446362 RepID=UPI0040347AE6